MDMLAEQKMEEGLSNESCSPVKGQLKCTRPHHPVRRLQKQKKQKDVKFVWKPVIRPSMETGTTADLAAIHARTQNFKHRQNPAIKTGTIGVSGLNHGHHLKAGANPRPGGLSRLRLALNQAMEA